MRPNGVSRLSAPARTAWARASGETAVVNATARGSAWSTTRANSASVMRALTGTATAPARLAARIRTAAAWQFSATTSNRSPAWSPASDSMAAAKAIAP